MLHSLLISEDFQIQVLSLESGFDPDLYVRRKGTKAYADALGQSQKYFDYLVERARILFPARTPEGKVKALNYLLPHIQRVPSRIVRDEWANEISHRLGIESTVLRQELRHAAGARTSSRVSSSSLGGITEAERVLIRALATQEMSAGADSNREGQDGDFDPARQAHFALTRERLHEGATTEALMETMMSAFEQGVDPMSLPHSDADRRLLASILMDEREELTPELLENSIHSLRRRVLLRQLAELQHQLKEAERRQDGASAAKLLQERIRLRKAMSKTGEPA